MSSDTMKPRRLCDHIFKTEESVWHIFKTGLEYDALSFRSKEECATINVIEKYQTDKMWQQMWYEYYGQQILVITKWYPFEMKCVASHMIP